jgi:hypothetical protein
MARRRPPRTLTLPRLEADGQTHRRDCECPRCDAGFRPSEGQRGTAAQRWEEQKAREQAAAALARKRARERIKSLRLALALEEDERRTAARLREEAALAERLRQDPRLAALLAMRSTGLPPEAAVEETERRFPPRGTSGWGDGQRQERRPRGASSR